MSTVLAGSRPDVTLKLPQLQNLCKRDPVAYKDDYLAQTRRLESELAILAVQSSSSSIPDGGGISSTPVVAAEGSQRVIELIQFAAAVSSSSYKGDESDRIAALLMGLLGGGKTNNNDYSMAGRLDRDVRKSIVSALIIMRNKGTVSPGPLQQLFFNVMIAVTDKGLREMLYRHLVNDIKNLNKKGKRDETVNRSIQTFLHRIVQTTTNNNHGNGSTAADFQGEHAELASKRAVDIVCELYRRRVWTDERAVAIIATGIDSPYTNVSNRAMRFFLGMEEQMAQDAKIKMEHEYDEAAKSIDYHLHSRKTNRRQRQTARAVKNRNKAQQRKEIMNNNNGDGILDIQQDGGVEASRKLFPAIELLRDPQGLAESVLKRLKNAKQDKYETKLLRINFVTRLTGNHELLLLPLYSFLQKYMGGHQRDVTAVLAYTVQACHALVPPDEIYGILKTIAHNFITERCTEEQMAVGINAARAICARVPAVLSREEAAAASSSTVGDNDDDDNDNGTTKNNNSKGGKSSSNNNNYMDVEAFARDLAGFAKHRDRSVRIAGSAWLNWVRQTHPGLLQGKDRGLQGTALARAMKNNTEHGSYLRYGQSAAASGVAGADLLAEYEAKKRAAALRGQDDDEGDGSDDEEEEEDDEIDFDEEEVEDEMDGEEEEIEGDDAVDFAGEDDEIDDEEEEEDGDASDDDEEAPELVKLDGNKIEPEIDLSKMTAEEREKLKQELSSTRIFSAEDFAKMRKLLDREERAKHDPREKARRKRAIAAGQDFEALSDDSDEEDDEDRGVNVKGTVDPEDIMAAATRKRQSKAEKLKKIIAGRTKFETKAREGGSTNIEKKRTKNFVMSKFSHDARSKGTGKSNRKRKKKDMKLKSSHESKKRRRKV